MSRERKRRLEMSRPDDLSKPQISQDRSQVLKESGASVLDRLPAADFPLVTVRLTLPEPGPDDPRSDAARLEDDLCERLGSPEVSLPISVLRDLRAVLSMADRRITVVVRAPRDPDQGWEVTRILPGFEGPTWYVAAVDLGTHRVWAQLLDGETGKVVGTATALNRQVQLAEDVAGRVTLSRDPEGRAQLAAAALTSIGEALSEASERCGADPGSIEHVVVAGSGEMISLMLSPQAEGVRTDDSQTFADGAAGAAVASGLGRYVSANSLVNVVPGVGGVVGGDVVGGLLASGIVNGDETSLYLDLGSGGEAVVGNRHRLVASSCPVEPVFEGAASRNGVPAVSGAIEGVSIDKATGKVEVVTIDGARASGICGAGLLAAVGAMVETGVLLPGGAFDQASGSPHMRCEMGRAEFVLVPAESSATGADIVVDESDVEAVMRAKAALFAEVTGLLGAASVSWGDLGRVVLAGPVGTELSLTAAVTVGLLPELGLERVEFLGNGSLLGARAVSTSRRMGSRAAQMASFMQVVDLSRDVTFDRRYQEAVTLRRTDVSGSLSAMDGGE